MLDFNAIGKDLELCDMGIAFTKGRARTKFVQHRKACMSAIKAANVADGLDAISDDDLLKELGL